MHTHSQLSFQVMALCFTIRDLFRPPEKVLKRMGLEPGQIVLDYGCGSGSWSLAAARLVEPSGKVYAADVDPFALQRIK
jgi:ubiquinone/menaquinone biosynthesis C-methylase UbiE